ncbi:MAG: S1 RNA-binding domain-containing protein, partial [Anaerolineales bacterium]|nr:S1 RNA-binding domain-containing protein [Anaerolineales bacterium]
EIDVQVLSVDLERQRVALSLKALQQDPWATLNDSHKEGQLVRATITRLTKFGAFAALKDRKHIEGLVHISELADSGVTHPKEVVQENDEVTLRIMKIDAERHRLGLSLKEVVSPRFAELDYAFYVAAEEKTEPDTEAAAEEPAAAPAPPEGSEDSAAVIAENTAEAGQPLAETIESVEAAEAAEGLDAQQPTQIAADETE